MDQFTIREYNNIQLIVCEPIERLGFKNAFSTRVGGVSPLPENSLSLGNFSQDERENVTENRRRFLEALGAGYWPLVTARQIHSADINLIDDERSIAADPAACDALASNIAGTLLAVQTADCLPVLIADERTGAFAAVHAGWRGTLAGIVARTIEKLQLRFGSDPNDLHLALGPAISAAVFEVGPEVIEAFQREYSYAADLVSNRKQNGKAHLDINLANIRQAVDAGVSENRIYDSGLCTWLRNDLFFSYRRESGVEKPVGRLMGIIGRDRNIPFRPVEPET